MLTLLSGCRSLLGIDDPGPLAIDAAPDAEVPPRLILGGGIADAPLNGRLDVYVITAANRRPVAGATIEVRASERPGVETTVVATATTDADGLARFTFDPSITSVDVAAVAEGHRSIYWVGVRGHNVTLPMQGTGLVAYPSAMYQGSIIDFSTVPDLGVNYTKYARVTSAKVDSATSARNAFGPSGTCDSDTTCPYTMVLPEGETALLATIQHHNNQGTAAPDDDTYSVGGYAMRRHVMVVDDEPASGVGLQVVPASELVDTRVSFGSPTGGGSASAQIGLELPEGVLTSDGVIVGSLSKVRVPSLGYLGAGATYRVTARTSGFFTGESSAAYLYGQTSTDFPPLVWIQAPKDITGGATELAWASPLDATMVSIIVTTTPPSVGLDVLVLDQAQRVAVPPLVQWQNDKAFATASALRMSIDVAQFSLAEDATKLVATSTASTVTLMR